VQARKVRYKVDGGASSNEIPLRSRVAETAVSSCTDYTTSRGWIARLMRDVDAIYTPLIETR